MKSPTYTLVELYPIADQLIVHADLYRIKDPHELEDMGFRDYFSEKTIYLIEWASNAEDWLPKPLLIMVCRPGCYDLESKNHLMVLWVQKSTYLKNII